MNIVLLETGGTIASEKLEKTIDLSLKESDYSAFGEVRVQRPYYILSENLTPDRWVTLAKEVYAAKNMGAEGILITHGSDTLPYTAAAIRFLCSDLEIPIVLTASNRPPEEQGSNAKENLTASFEFLEQSPKGVSVVWQNPDGTVYVHSGTALAEAVGDWFFSLGEPIAQKKDGAWQFFPKKEEKKKPIPLPDGFCERVAYLRALPGQDYTKIDFGANPVAVLHSLYHSGTVCAQGQNASFEQLKKRCKTENLPLYICPAKRAEENTYASTHILAGEDVHRLVGISAEAAFTLLTLAYNQKEEDPQVAICRFLDE